MSDIKAHIMERTLHDLIIDPEHGQRDEDVKDQKVFRAAKKRLQEDGHIRCFICGTDKDIQYHHLCAEDMTAEKVDFAALKEACEAFDPYGYGRLKKNLPMTSVSEERNLMALCQKHHTGLNKADGGFGLGVHSSTMSTWISQKTAPSLVPQDGETAEEVLQEVETGK